MVSFEMNDRKKIGLGLTGFGILFSFLGIIFFFDKGLLAMGNILFISGVMLTIGLKSTMQFFTKPKNYKGTISFGAGFFLVLIGWAVIGMILETYGFLVLFRYCYFALLVFFCKYYILSRFRNIDHSLGRTAVGVIIRFGFWPTLAVFVQRIPILGWLIQQPFVAALFDRNRGKRVPV